MHLDKEGGCRSAARVVTELPFLGDPLQKSIPCDFLGTRPTQRNLIKPPINQIINCTKSTFETSQKHDNNI